MGLNSVINMKIENVTEGENKGLIRYEDVILPVKEILLWR